MTRRSIPIALALANVAVAPFFVLQRASGSAAAWTGLPLDDAWIHLVYARAVAAGQGFAYNAGQPEAGFTSPAWVCLLALLVSLQGALGGALVLWVKALGVALGCALSWACARLARALSASTTAGLLAGALVAIEPCLAFGRVSGMETTLAALCGVGIALALVQRRTGWLAASMAAGILARPEMAVLVAVALAAVASAIRGHLISRRAFLAFVAPAAAALGWAARSLAVTGRALPSTFYVKSSTHAFGESALSIARALGDTVTLSWGLGLVLFAAGARVAWRHRDDRGAAVIATVAGPLALLLAVAATRSVAQWQPFYWSRYWHPALPLLVTVAAAGADAAVREAWTRAAASGSLGDRVVRLACLAAVGVAVFRLGPALRDSARLYSWNCQNVNEMQVAAGRWLRAHTSREDAVATNDAGAIRFIGDRRTVDLTGLNAHRIVDGELPAVLTEARPRYFVVFPAWFPNLLRNGRYEVVRRFAAPKYTICDCPQDELVVLERRRVTPPR